jgi:hypothetical protein
MPRPMNQALVLTFLLFPALGPRLAQAQVAVVRVKSLEALRADLHYLARQAGQAPLAKTAEDFLQKMLGGKDPDGIDPRRPFGLYLLWPKKVQDFNNLNVPAVAFLPIADEKQFFGMIEKMGYKTRKEGEVYRLLQGEEIRGTLRLANQCAYVANQLDALTGKLPEPTALVPTGGAESVVSAALFVERFPKEYRDALDSLFNPLGLFMSVALGNDEKGKQPDETEEQFRQRQANSKRLRALPGAMKAGLVSFLDQTREIGLRLDVENLSHRATLELAVLPRPDTELESFAAYAGGARSRFAGQVRAASMGLFVHFPPKGSLDEWIGRVEEVSDAVRDFADPAFRGSILKGLRILFETLAADGFDFGLFREKREDGAGALVAGLKVHQGRRLDHLLRDVFKSMKTADKAQWPVDWNHARHGAARIHRVRFKDFNETAWVALRDDVVFAGFGEEGLKSVEAALDRFGEETVVPTPLVEFVAAPAWLFDRKQLEAYRKRDGADADKDRLRITLEGGKDYRLRVTLNTALLKWLAGQFE